MGHINFGYVQFGLGPIGVEILKQASEVHGLSVIGAVDIDPEKVGKDIGDILGTEAKGKLVVENLNQVTVNEEQSKIAIHATGSNLANVWPQIKNLLDHGFSVVSTCEELSYPWYRYAELSKEIDDYAKNKGLFVIGTGVNPGFIMDTMTLFLTSVTNKVTNINVSRKVDVSKRRIPLQKKVGVGMTVDQFNELAAENKIGHVGLEESARLIAYGLGISLNEVKNSIQPVIANKAYSLTSGNLKPGQVSGQHQIVEATTTDGRKITLELVMAVDVEQEDRIRIDGSERTELVIPNGIFGDTATAAMSINVAKTVANNPTVGLLTMADIPLSRNFHIRAQN
jgi:2,4-diaminopentanoate dehydrogenase